MIKNFQIYFYQTVTLKNKKPVDFLVA